MALPSLGQNGAVVCIRAAAPRGTEPGYSPGAGTGTSLAALEEAAPALPSTELGRKPSAFLLRGALVSGKHQTSLAALLPWVSRARGSGCHCPRQSRVAWPVSPHHPVPTKELG